MQENSDPKNSKFGNLLGNIMFLCKAIFLQTLPNKLSAFKWVIW